MSKKFQYTLANCNKSNIIETMDRLSDLLNKELKVSISTDKLALRFMACVPHIDVSQETLLELPFKETVIDSLEIYGTFFRGNLEVSDLEYDYLKEICFPVANKLKSDGVVKISGSKLLALLCQAMGYKSHQAFLSVSEKGKTQPEFKTFRFEDQGQDFYEFVTVDGLIVDCQPHQANVWCGMRGSVLPFTDQFIIVFDRYSKPENFNTLDYFGKSSTLNYSAEVAVTPLDYQKGFLSFLAGDPAPAKGEVSEQFEFGYNTASWNTERSPLFVEQFATK